MGMLVVAGTAGLLSWTGTDSSSEDQVDATRSYLQKWVDTERVLSAEKRDWALGKELLGDRIELLRHEIESLQTRLDAAKESVQSADQKREQLMAAKEELKQSSSALVGVVEGLELRMVALLEGLPEPIVERVQPLSQRLPKSDEQEAKQSLGERFQNIVGILNEINKFNAEITASSEIRTLKDGSSAEVTALYVGLGQAYYVTADGKHAGVGTSSDYGWFWRHDDAVAKDVQRAVAILQNEHVAEFVSLPVRID